MTIPVIDLSQSYTEQREPDEYARLCERIIDAGGASFEDAEAALNLIFYVGGRTSSPWCAPHVLLDVFEGELRKGTAFRLALHACISAKVIDALEQHFTEMRR